MRIATWNLNRPARKGQRNPVIIEQLQKVDADIWVLTETHEVISPGEAFGQISTKPDTIHKEGEHRVTLWSRYPITQQLPTYDPTVAVCGDIATPMGPLRLYGSIITWANNPGPNGTSKKWGEHYRAITAHSEDWAKLSLAMPAFCAAGDFNEMLHASGRYGTRKGRAMLTEALARSNLTCLTQAYRIDHICLTAGWASQIEVTMWPAPALSGKPVSDHPGYYVDLDFGY